jgi:ribosomal protein L37AE/L43A
MRFCDEQWPAREAMGRTGGGVLVYSYELTVSTRDTALACLPYAWLWLPLVRLKIWSSFLHRELRQTAAGTFEEHVCKAMTMEPEGNGYWRCEECADVFQNSDALQAHYTGLSHQFKTDLKDLADARIASDDEQARAQVTQERERENNVHLREKHLTDQRAIVVERLARARAEADEKDRVVDGPEGGEGKAAGEEAKGEADEEVVYVKTNPAAGKKKKR